MSFSGGSRITVGLPTATDLDGSKTFAGWYTDTTWTVSVTDLTTVSDLYATEESLTAPKLYASWTNIPN